MGCTLSCHNSSTDPDEPVIVLLLELTLADVLQLHRCMALCILALYPSILTKLGIENLAGRQIVCIHVKLARQNVHYCINTISS